MFSGMLLRRLSSISARRWQQPKSFATSNGGQRRADRRAKRSAPKPAENNSAVIKVACGALAVSGVAGLLYYDIVNNKEGQLSQLYRDSALEGLLKFLYNKTMGNFNQIFDPSSEKLVPDWPTAPCYAGVPPGTPAPPLLVVDLEKTLVGSEYDTHYGWRHVKRPGLDKFINSLSNYYEIVLFSENDIGVTQDILMAIDPEGKCHKLGASAAEARGTAMLKRLDLMNRDIRKIILIDDNPESAQLCLRNTLFVPPFDDVRNRHDTVLEELVPLLQALVHDQVTDFRTTFEDLGTNEATEAVVEYRMRLSEKKRLEHQKRNKGIGGLIRGESAELEKDGFELKSAVLSPTDIVGHAPKATATAPAPSAASQSTLKKLNSFQGTSLVKDTPNGPATKKTGALFGWLQQREKDVEDTERAKREKMNEIYQQRMAAKAQKEKERMQD